MNAENYQEWFNWSKNFTVPFNELNKISTDICKRMTAQNLELMIENYSRYSDRLKKISIIKKPEDFINFQKESLNEDVVLTLHYFQKMIHLFIENLEEMTHVYGTHAAKATEKTVEKVKKHTK